MLRGLRRGCSWDLKPIICCLWLPFPYPERGGKVAFPPACSSPSGRQGRGEGWALPCCWAGSLLPGAWSCRQHSQAWLSEQLLWDGASEPSLPGFLFLFTYVALLPFCGKKKRGEVHALKGFSITLCTLLSWREGPSEASFLSLFHVKSSVQPWSKAGPGWSVFCRCFSLPLCTSSSRSSVLE